MHRRGLNYTELVDALDDNQQSRRAHRDRCIYLAARKSMDLGAGAAPAASDRYVQLHPRQLRGSFA